MDSIKETSYENYSKKSAHYDLTRKPIGLKEMISAFKKYGPDIIETMADIGCGTGNYMIELRDEYKYGVGVDINEGML